MPLDLSSLNPEQRAAAVQRGGPVLILAGAGTGKTRVIVYRAASLIEEGVAPDRILAVTFTNKAAGEMRRRIDELVPGRAAGVWVYTFHAFAARLLRRHAQSLKLPRDFTIYDSDDQKRLVIAALKDLGMEEEKNKARLYVGVISRAKDDLLDPESYAIYAMAQRDPFRQNVAKVYRLYQSRLEASGGLDFGDLLMKLARLLKEDERVRELYQRRFEHVLVDEYQDTNHAQYLITKTLAALHRNLCVVGDPDQSIYRFRGATIRNILEFESDFKDVATIKLEQNYRSTPNILNAAAAVIGHNRRRAPKSLWTRLPEGEPVSVLEFADERAEARGVVGRIIGLVDAGASLKDVAVFYRTNAQSRSFEEALTLAQLPYRVVGAVRFYERKEVKDVLAFARAALNPADSLSLQRVLNLPPRGIGKAAETALLGAARDKGLSLREILEARNMPEGLSTPARQGAAELAHLLERIAQAARGAGPTEAMQGVLDRSGYWDWLEASVDTDPEAAGRLGNLQELLNAVREFEDTPAKEEEGARDLGRFLEDVALQTGADGYDAERPAVTLMTVHLAKGLEFPAVFATGLEEGLFPIAAGNSSEEELEEERRLCYVAMTRARRSLFLTYAASRRLFGMSYSNIPSRFIVEARLFGPGEEAAPAGQAVAAPVPRGPALRAVARGQRVRHPEFGVGKIVEKSGSGEGLKVTVVFDNGLTKKLLVRYAPLAPAS